jgi:predicted DCC family thiol-disulfide oxidoreductase YuxK
MSDLATLPEGTRIVLMDGTCVFCNRVVAFILARDRRGEFRFAYLQGRFAKDVKARHGADPEDIDGIYVLLDPGTPRERLLVDGEAGREIWPRLFWFGFLLRFVPLFILNWEYRLLARYRYRLFGKYAACRIPTEGERRQFVERTLPGEVSAPVLSVDGARQPASRM